MDETLISQHFKGESNIKDLTANKTDASLTVGGVGNSQEFSLAMNRMSLVQNFNARPRLLEDEDDDTICQAAGQDVQGLAEVIINAAAAFIFLIFACFAAFMLVKFLLIENRGKQRSMILFYVLSMCQLSLRAAYFTVSCFTDQWSQILATLELVTTVITIVVGVSHSQNLSRLVLDLSAVRLQTAV